MIIDLLRLLDGAIYEMKLNQSLEIERLSANGKKIRFNRPTKIIGGIFKTDEGIFINANILYEFTDICDRCLKEFTCEGKSVLSGRISGKGEKGSEEELIIYYDKAKVNLREAIETTIILDLPMKSLCDDNCRGFCPKCGKNLNEGQCNCKNINVDPRLAKLRELLD